MSMTHAQIIEEIKLLSAEDKKVLLDEIWRIVREESRPALREESPGAQLYGIGKPEFGKRDESLDSEGSTARLSQRLYGILKFDGEPPNDEEVKDLIADYLIRKYS